MQLMNIGLSRRTDLGIKALQVLTDTPSRMGGAQLAEEIGTTTQFLPQVLGPLVKAGWVDSERGPRGGYQARISLEEISLLELVETIEGAIESGRCVLRDGPCPGTESCPVHTAWMSAREILVKKLQEISLAQALKTEVGA
jgi:Rrf2 family iron-sulfur cluster assembly transcriptional regulator